MGITLVSDIHLEFNPLLDKPPLSIFFPEEKKQDVLVIAGDIGYPHPSNIKEYEKYKHMISCASKCYKNVVVITGNHEYYTHRYTRKEIDEIVTNVCSEYSNVHFLQKSSVVLSVNGTCVKFSGCTLWSDIDTHDYKSMGDCKYISRGEYLSLHQDHRDWLASLPKDEPTIIITHHLPSTKANHIKYPLHTGFYSDLEYMFKPPVCMWLCGHTHERIETQINDIPVYINPIGYKGEKRDTEIRYEDICI